MLPIGPSGSTLAAVAGSQASVFRPLTKRKPSQIRLPSLFRLEPRMPGHDEHRRLVGRARRVAGAARARDRERGARAARVLAGPRQRADRREVGGRIVEQRARDRLHRALVGEVVEVRDLAALVEQEARAAAVRGLGARRAAVHRARLHDEVVVGPVERVGEQRLDPRADRVAFHVAGDRRAARPGSSRSRRSAMRSPGWSGVIASRPGISVGSARRRATSCRKSSTSGTTGMLASSRHQLRTDR